MNGQITMQNMTMVKVPTNYKWSNSHAEIVMIKLLTKIIRLNYYIEKV